MMALAHKFAEKYWKPILRHLLLKQPLRMENERDRPLLEYVIDEVKSLYKQTPSGYECRICGRKHFTSRGLYFHLTRKHADVIIYLIEDLVINYMKLDELWWKQ